MEGRREFKGKGCSVLSVGVKMVVTNLCLTSCSTCSGGPGAG